MKNLQIKQKIVFATLFGILLFQGVQNTFAQYDYSYDGAGYDYTLPVYDYTSPTYSGAGYDYTAPTYTGAGYDYVAPTITGAGYDYTAPVYDYTSPTYTNSSYTYTPAVYDTSYVYPTTATMYYGTGYSYPTYGYTSYGYTGGYTYTNTNTNTSCPSGTTLVNGACQYPTACPSGQTLINNVCQPNTQCPAGQTLINNVCQPNTQCPSGTTYINGTCQIQNVVTTYTCSNGTVVTYASQCPTIYTGGGYTYTYPTYTTPTYGYQTCWDGTTISYNSVCPAQYKLCANGTNIPINQTCYFGSATYPSVQAPQVVKFNNVVTSVVTEITNTSGRCNGIGLIPNGVNSTGWFEYGETVNLGRETTHTSIGRASTAPFSNLLTNLKPNTKYYCRAVMENQYGIVKGEVVSFVSQEKAVTYVKPVTTTTKKTTTVTKKNEITCTDGTTVWVKNESSATLLNKGEKLIVIQIEKDTNALVPGSATSYKLTYKNLSDSRLTGITIKVSIPQEIQFALATEGTYDEVTHVLTVSNEQIEPYAEKTVAISGRVTQGAQIGRSIVTSASVAYIVPTTDIHDEVTAYVVNVINADDGSNTLDTGAKKVIGAGGTHGFLPSSLVEWLALITIILIIFILARSIYASYKEEDER